MKTDIYDKIESYPVVTFDVFDTLIKRDSLTFKNITEIINLDYKEKYNKKLPFYYCRERIHSPKPARKRKPQKEVDINSMYDVLHICNKDEVKRMEMKAEIQCATPNPQIYELYSWCRQCGKKIYAISDMYLPESCIRKILEKCGYQIDKIYVSQQYNASKVSGKLFEKFLLEEDLCASDVIHIGDDEKADVVGAKKNGIKSIHIKNFNDRPQYLKKGTKLCDNILYKFINNRLDCCNTEMEKTGYEVLGPVLYYFIKWLNLKLNEHEIQKVFFLSRDGYLIKKAYEQLYGNDNSINYLQVSSKSVRKAYESIGNQRQLLIQYLKEQGFEGKVAIVDIGWSGNLHKLIKEVSKEFADVYGFYFGTFSKFNYNVTDGISGGFLNINRYTKAKVFMSAGFIEVLFSDTSKGTVERYEQIDDKVIPVLSEKNPNGEYLNLLQMGALKFVDDWHKSAFNNFEYAIVKLIRPLLDLSINPTNKDVNYLSNDFAGSGKNYIKLSGNDNKKYTLMNVKKLLFDMRNVVWKGGFFKKNFNKQIINKLYGLVNPLMVIFKI